MTDDEVRLWREVYLRLFTSLELSATECATQAVREFRAARQKLALEAETDTRDERNNHFFFSTPRGPGWVKFKDAFIDRACYLEFDESFNEWRIVSFVGAKRESSSEAYNGEQFRYVDRPEWADRSGYGHK